MRVWLIALYLVCFNLGLSLMNTANVWYATYPSRYDFTTHSWYTVETVPHLPNNTQIEEQMETLSAQKTQISPGWLQGVADFLSGIAGGVSNVLTLFAGVFTGMFTQVGTLIHAIIPTAEGTPDAAMIDALANTIQGVIDFVMIYGMIQFMLGRSGKTIE